VAYNVDDPHSGWSVSNVRRRPCRTSVALLGLVVTPTPPSPLVNFTASLPQAECIYGWADQRGTTSNGSNSPATGSPATTISTAPQKQLPCTSDYRLSRENVYRSKLERRPCWPTNRSGWANSICIVPAFLRLECRATGTDVLFPSTTLGTSTSSGAVATSNPAFAGLAPLMCLHWR
jgi:hypothetical protein